MLKQLLDLGRYFWAIHTWHAVVQKYKFVQTGGWVRLKFLYTILEVCNRLSPT